MTRSAAITAAAAHCQRHLYDDAQADPEDTYGLVPPGTWSVVMLATDNVGRVFVWAVTVDADGSVADDGVAKWHHDGMRGEVAGLRRWDDRADSPDVV